MNRHKPVCNHSGSTFDSFLEQEDILKDVTDAATNRVIAWQTQNHLRPARSPCKPTTARTAANKTDP